MPFIIQLKAISKMYRILIVACVSIVVASQGHSDTECPFAMKDQLSLNGFLDEDVLHCSIYFRNCTNGLLAQTQSWCSLHSYYYLPVAQDDSQRAHNVASVRLFFGRNVTINPQFLEGTVLSIVHVTVHMDMDNVTVLKTIPGNGTQEENKRYMDAVMELLPQMINKDPDFQMKFRRREENTLLTVNEITTIGEEFMEPIRLGYPR